MNNQLTSYYSNIFETDLLSEINEIGSYFEFKTGNTIIDVGQTVKLMPLLIDGAIKVMRNDDQGDELLLYFLEIGDACAMTFSCCLGNKKSNIKAIAETDVVFIGIPVQKMDQWMTKYSSWRKFVLESYQTRMTELLETIDSIAFLKMDDRLLKYLKDKAMINGNTIIKNTHQQIAQDLHTSRVVISRLLKKMENQGLIKLYRNSLELLVTV